MILPQIDTNEESSGKPEEVGDTVKNRTITDQWNQEKINDDPDEMIINQKDDMFN